MYEYDFRVGFSQSDNDQKMTVTSIIDMFQDCSCFHSDDLGIGFDYLRPRNLVWIINYWELEFNRFPRYGEKLTVGTFPYDFKGFFGYRNFYLRSNDEYIVKANSLWTLMDWSNMLPSRATSEMIQGYELGSRLDMTYGSRKIALPDTSEVDITKPDPVRISRHNLDSNGHVNNGQYVKIAYGYTKEDRDISHMRVEYRKQAHLGDMIYPVVYSGNDTVTVSLEDGAGEPYCIMELTYRQGNDQ